MEKQQEKNEIFNQLYTTQSQICLIEGASGCGKTTLFLNHIHALIEQGESINHCLNFVSSQNQIKSLQQRYQQLFEEETTIPFSTLVGFCYNLIKKYNQAHQLETWKVFKDLHPIVDQILVKHFDHHLTKDERNQLMEAIAKVKTTFATENQIQKMQVLEHIDFLYVYQQYEKEKKRLKIMDFEDCLQQGFQLLNTKEIQEQVAHIRWIHIDDAQDLSFLAHCIINQLTKSNTHVHYYYDTHQVFNQRHAADIQPLHHLKSTNDAVETWQLTQNYRNGSTILELANQFYYNDAKKMECQSEHEGEHCYKGFISTLELHEYALNKAKESEGSLAFIARHSESLIPLVDLLDQQQVSYQCRHSQDIFKQSFVNDIICFITLLHDPRNLQALISVLPKLEMKIGEKGMAQIVSDLQENQQIDIYQAMIDSRLKSDIKNRIRLHIEELREIQFKSTLDCLAFIMEKSQYRKKLLEQSILSTHPAMIAIQTLAKRYPNPSEFVQRMHELKSIQIPAHARITCATIEELQGKEFDTVILVDMQSSLFPRKESEKERQLLYSAMTKAQNHLEFLFAKSAGNTRLRPSPYLLEMFKRNEQESQESQEKPTPKVPRKGKKILHSSLGEGTILSIDRHMAKVRFANKNERVINLTFCLENGLATLII